MKRITTLALVMGLTIPAVAMAEAETPPQAAACVACHGEGGAKPIAPTYPVLAGQYANYLEQALHEYKSGARKNMVMAPQAAMLSDDDIKVVAEYFSKQPGPLYTPSAGPAASAAE